MCTLSWLIEADRYRVFFNRDELRTRRPAVPPAVRRRGRVRFVAPLDGDFGGSWIAVSESGLTLCLLNGFPATAPPPSPARYTSRGQLPLSLIDLPSASRVREQLETTELGCYRPFLLAVFEPEDRLLARWSGRALSFDPQGLARPPLISSSFYTEEVRESRSAVFREIGRGADTSDAVERHLAFHRSHRPERGPFSPCMHRPDAETVSFTEVEVDPGRVQMTYTPRSPCRGEPSEPPLALERRELPRDRAS